MFPEGRKGSWSAASREMAVFWERWVSADLYLPRSCVSCIR